MLRNPVRQTGSLTGGTRGSSAGAAGGLDHINRGECLCCLAGEELRLATVRFDREDKAGGTDGLREAEREVASARADVREPYSRVQLERSDDQVRATPEHRQPRGDKRHPGLLDEGSPR
jgi:hypothetical protein